MPGFADLLSDSMAIGRRRSKSRPVSTCSTISAISAHSSKERDHEAILFPTAFGVSVGDSFDDVAAVPYGLTIQGIRRITIFHGAWVSSLVTTYMLSDGTDLVCSNGHRGGKTKTYDLAPNETLLGLGGLLGFIKNTDFIVDDLMIDYLQFHIRNVDTGVVRIVPEDPESYGSSQGADFFVQGPIYAFAGRSAGYISQIQPYVSKEKNVEFGLPVPGVDFDDRKACHGERIRRIKRITIRAGAWLEGLEVTYQLANGSNMKSSHGGCGGEATTTDLAEDEVLEAVSLSNSGPFPFCDAIRIYLSRYSKDGQVLSRRTIPDKSAPALGYEYEYSENTWIRSGNNGSGFQGNRIVAFAGKCGSYIEELACWVRDGHTGEETLVEPRKLGPQHLLRSQHCNDLVNTSNLLDNSSTRGESDRPKEQHRLSAASLESQLPGPGNSLKIELQSSNHLLHGSPELILPSSVPSSPSLSSSLRRLSTVSSAGSVSGSDGIASPVDAVAKRRLSGQIAVLRRVDDISKQATPPDRVQASRVSRTSYA